MPDARMLLDTSLIALVFHVVLAPAAALHALLYKRDSRAAFGWIALCMLLPIAGPVLYLIAGVNRVRRRAHRLGLPDVRIGYERGEAAEPAAASGTGPGMPEEADFPELARAGASLSRHRLVGGNDLEPLFNGEQAYPAMLEAIGKARHSVFLVTYILDAGRIGGQFEDALAEAAARGVDVRVIVDGFGELYSLPRASRRLNRRGVSVARFLPPSLIPPQLSLNMRLHHKILVVDGKTGFTGGMNIGDRHLAADVDNPARVVDLHFRLSGPVVDQLTAEFLRSWEFVTGRAEPPRAVEPAPAGELACRTLTDGPDEDLDRLTMLLTAAIAQARRRVMIMTPYFLPPREIIGALQAASLRGVAVDLVLPEKNNLPYVHWATRNMLWELLFRDIRVHYQPPPFVHTKLLVIDDAYSQIGSANWDARSLRLNFELQVEVFGRAFAERMAEHISQAIARSRRVNLEEVDGRPFAVRLRDALCWLFTPYL